MITAADLIRWADDQAEWLDEFNFRLTVDYLRGQRMVRTDEPWHILVLLHASGHYSTMQLMKYDSWPEARLQGVLKQMVDVGFHHVKEKIKKLRNIGWSDSVNLKPENENLEDDTGD